MGDEVFLEKLTPEMVDTALAMCDANVGENMYTRADIEAAIKGDKSFFYMLYNEKHEPIGYTYIVLMNKKEFLDFSKLTERQFDSLGFCENVTVGNIRSIAVAPAYRGKHYATLLFDFTDRFLTEQTGAAVAAGALWRMGEEIPMKKVFEQFSYTHLADTELVWYDKVDMYCPYCRGRCVCGSSVYYKKLEDKR